MSSYGGSYHREEEDGNKPLISFIVGLLVGGLLIWAFSVAPEQQPVTEQFVPRVDRAEDACLTQGGIPIYNDQEMLADCKKL